MEQFFVLRLFSSSYELLGPLTGQELEANLSAGKVAHADLLFSPPVPTRKSGQWSRILDHRQFSKIVPPPPTEVELKKIQTDALKRVESSAPKQLTTRTRTEFKDRKKCWYLQTEGTEFGPFNFLELGKIFDSDRLKDRVFVWRQGLSNWIEAKSLQEVIDLTPSFKAKDELQIERGSNKRTYPRSSMIATVTVGGITPPARGVCLDISETGLRVGRLHTALSLGAKCRLTVTPVFVTGLEKFEVDAVVVWSDSNADTTGFRFGPFRSENEKRKLKRYLEGRTKPDRNS